MYSIVEFGSTGKFFKLHSVEQEMPYHTEMGYQMIGLQNTNGA
jgi:hypothetical protein